MAEQAPRISLGDLIKEQIEQVEKCESLNKTSWSTSNVDKKKEFPTIRTDVVVGIHALHSANDVVQTLAVAVPALKPALDRLGRQLDNALINYRCDVENLEQELLIASNAEDSLGAKLIAAEAAFKVKCDKVEQGHLRMFEKNEGFVQAIQERNRQQAELEVQIEERDRQLDVLRSDKNHLIQGNNEAERYIKLLLNHITRDGAKHLPAKLRRFG